MTRRYSNWDYEAYKEAYEAEHHLHNREIWFGVAASPAGTTNAGDSDVMAAFQIDAGNDTWGSWQLLLGSADTPVQSGRIKFDVHRLIISDVETDKTATRIQFGTGASGSEAVVTEILLYPAKVATQVDPPFSVICPRINVSTLFSARCWVSGANTSTVDFYLGIHEYEL